MSRAITVTDDAQPFFKGCSVGLHSVVSASPLRMVHLWGISNGGHEIEAHGKGTNRREDIAVISIIAAASGTVFPAPQSCRPRLSVISVFDSDSEHRFHAL